MGFVRVAGTAQVAAGSVQEFQIAGKTIAVANVEGQYYAISNVCPHRGGPLGQGTMSGNQVTCPWHGWTLDVTNGKVSHSSMTAVACYAVEVRGGDIFVDLEAAPLG